MFLSCLTWSYIIVSDQVSFFGFFWQSIRSLSQWCPSLAEWNYVYINILFFSNINSAKSKYLMINFARSYFNANLAQFNDLKKEKDRTPMIQRTFLKNGLIKSDLDRAMGKEGARGSVIPRWWAGFWVSSSHGITIKQRRTKCVRYMLLHIIPTHHKSKSWIKGLFVLLQWLTVNFARSRQSGRDARVSFNISWTDIALNPFYLIC